MRSLKEHPVTLQEIEECLLELATEIASEGRRGDMRPILLRRAAKIVSVSVIKTSLRPVSQAEERRDERESAVS